VLSGCYLARFKLARLSAIPSDINNTFPLQSFSSNLISLMIHMAYEMDVDLVNYLYQKLFGYTCMLSIRGKHMVLITLTWLKLD
jgi:hypothetical protein